MELLARSDVTHWSRVIGHVTLVQSSLAVFDSYLTPLAFENIHSPFLLSLVLSFVRPYSFRPSFHLETINRVYWWIPEIFLTFVTVCFSGMPPLFGS